MKTRFLRTGGLRFRSFSRLYRQAKAESCLIGEAKKAGYKAHERHGLTEAVVKYIWNYQLIASDEMCLANGKPLVVHSPGIVNHEAGPDFRGAKLSLGDSEPAEGDIEIHVLSSDWRAHGHHLDRRYDNVLLHVVMWNNAGRSTVLNAKGDEIVQLELYGCLGRELSVLIEDFQSEEYPFEVRPGECQKMVGQTDETLLGLLLDCAGDERMEKKAERMASNLEKSTLDELIYLATAEALGYKNLKTEFRELALRASLGNARRIAAPLEEKDRVYALEAYLFGVADLPPKGLPATAGGDAETEQYASALRNFWEGLEPCSEHMIIGRHRWSRSGSRPQNFPQRRIAALARFLSKAVERSVSNELKEKFKAAALNSEMRKGIKELRDWTISLFSHPESRYWEHRYVWNGARRPKGEKLVGEDRANIILVNAFLPALLLDASLSSDERLEQKIHSFYAALPKLKPNYLLKVASKRILGLSEKDQTVVNSARRQQGLMQLYYDFCSHSSAACDSCNFAKFAEVLFKKATVKRYAQ